MSDISQMPRERFSRTATLDVRDALAAALRRVVEDLRFVGSQTDRFAEVFDVWPSFLETAVFPAAAIVPGGFKFVDSSTTPKLLEETWEPQGLPGWGLYKTSECQTELSLVIRTDLVGERPALMRAVEDAFQDPQLNMAKNGPRYGLVKTLPDYYGVNARFAVLDGSVIDSEDSAMRERRDAVFTISASAPRVQVGPVFPLALRITKTTLDPAGNTIEVTNRAFP